MSDFRAVSSFLDKRILDARGEHVGRVYDLVFDTTEGRIAYVNIALEAGSRARTGGHVTVPWSVMRRVDTGADAAWQVAAERHTLELLALRGPHRS